MSAEYEQFWRWLRVNGHDIILAQFLYHLMTLRNLDEYPYHPYRFDSGLELDCLDLLSENLHDSLDDPHTSAG